jgi:hypothetical protein
MQSKKLLVLKCKDQNIKGNKNEAFFPSRKQYGQKHLISLFQKTQVLGRIKFSYVCAKI